MVSMMLSLRLASPFVLWLYSPLLLQPGMPLMLPVPILALAEKVMEEAEQVMPLQCQDQVVMVLQPQSILHA